MTTGGNADPTDGWPMCHHCGIPRPHPCESEAGANDCNHMRAVRQVRADRQALHHKVHAVVLAHFDDGGVLVFEMLIGLGSVMALYAKELPEPERTEFLDEAFRVIRAQATTEAGRG